MAKPISERDSAFQFVVLSALWCILLLLCGAKSGYIMRQIINVRSEMIAFGDLYGVQSDAARKYRREVAYPEVPRG